MGKTTKDIKDSLDFWGVARTHVIQQALFSAKWEDVLEKRRVAVTAQCGKIAKKVLSAKRVTPRLKIKALFTVMKLSQGMIDKGERKAGRGHTADYLHWQSTGWLKGKKPWKE
jgi:hypothetical protein